MRAEDLAQRGVEQVRAGVVAHDGGADFAVDDGVDVSPTASGCVATTDARRRPARASSRRETSATMVLWSPE